MQLIKGVIIYPISDEWVSTSPFGVGLGAKLGFVVAEGDVSAVLSDYEQDITSKLYSLGNISNALNIIEKTRSQKNFEVKGIGGFAKLKEFTFSLTDTIEDYITLYGKKIKYFKIIDGVLDVDFLGKIQQIDKENNLITFSCEGYMSLSNECILVEDDVGGSIFVGDPLNGMVKLTKDPDYMRFIFEAYLKYKIQAIYMSGKDSSEMYKVQNSWVQEGKYIYINTGEEYFTYNKILGNLQDNEYSDNDSFASIFGNTAKQTILITPYALVEVNFEESASINLIKKFSHRNFDFTIVDRTLELNKTCTVATHILNPLTLKYFYELNDATVECELDGGGTINKKITLVRVKKLPAFAFEGDRYFSDDISEPLNVLAIENWGDLYQSEDLLFKQASWDNRFLKLKENQSDSWTLIKIEDEKMLVIKKCLTSYSYTGSADFAVPFMLLHVIRGWEDTTIVEHAAGTRVTMLSTSSQKLYINIKAPLKALRDIPYKVGYNSNAYRAYFNDIYNESRLLYLHFPDHFRFRETLIGLDFAIPDFSGDILNSKLVGNLGFVFTPPYGEGEQFFDKVCLASFLTAKSRGDEVENQFIYFGTSGKGLACGIYAWNLGDGGADPVLAYPVIMDSMTLCHILPYVIFSEQSIKRGSFNHKLSGCWRIVELKDYPSDQRQSVQFEYVDDLEIPYTFDTLEKLKHSNLSLRIVDLKNLRYSISEIWGAKFKYNCLNFQLEMRHMYLDLDVEVDMGDNDFYAKVVSSDVNTVLLDSFANGSFSSGVFKEGNYYFICTYTMVAYFKVTDLGKISGLTFVNISDFSGNINTIIRDSFGNLFFCSLRSDNKYCLINFVVNGDDVTIYDTAPLILDNLTLVTRLDQYEWVISPLLRITVTYVPTVWTVKIFKVTQENSNSGNPVSIVMYLLKTYLNLTNSDFDTSAFDQAKLDTSAQKCSLLIENSTTLNEVLDSICKEHGLMLFENNNALISISFLAPPVTVTNVLSDSNIIFKKDKAGISIKYTDMDYLISEMDIYYRYFNSKYEKIIKSVSATWLKSYFDIAKTYLNGSKSKVILKLTTVNDDATARICSTIKMQYHFKPLRIIKVESPNIDLFSLGDWLKIESDYIEDTDDKSYLVIESSLDPDTNICMYTMQEFVDSMYLYGLQEVPENYGNIQYEEVAAGGDEELQEKPNMLI